MEICVPGPVEEIITRLRENGYEAYIVGGCVRDMLLGREPGDWDITTSALPQEVKRVFRRTLDTGIQHGTVTVMFGKEGYEVTTYRIDGSYSDGRHPDQVLFTPSLKEDLKRRDFTINAMAYNRETGIVDEFGGAEDLKAGVIRCVGNAVERFTEDALRILRALRFSAQLGFSIEEETFQAIRQIAPNLVHVSRERIQTELTKLLLSPHPETIALVKDRGIDRFLSPAFQKAFEKGVRIPESLPAVKSIRWASFLKDLTPEEAAAVLKDLKLDNDTISRVKTLVRWVWQPIGTGEEPDQASVRRVMSRMEPELFDHLMILKEGLAPSEQVTQVKKLASQIRSSGDCISLKMLAVTGHDLIQAGVRPGKAIGETLGSLLDLVLEDPSRNTREYLLSQIRREG